MKTSSLCILILLWLGTHAVGAQTNAPIPFDQLSARAGAQYQGDGLAISVTPFGARLRCLFQRLEGEATADGLWLTSTVEDERAPVAGNEAGDQAKSRDRFRVVAVAMGRQDGVGDNARSTLPLTGTVKIAGSQVQFVRPRLVEEYTVSLDGVRQDFVLLERPDGAGKLRVDLAVSGATGEATTRGALLVLGGSGRKIAYSRLRVIDGTGRELPARMEVPDNSEFRIPSSEIALAIVVDDTNAVYPVRIDPTFSDSNWISLNPSIPGANDTVYAAVLDVSGNLYIGGDFTVVGDVLASGIAQWNGSRWSALGEGIPAPVPNIPHHRGAVSAIAVSGGTVFAGGYFTKAGDVAANNIAKWDGNQWSALGLGLEGDDFPGVSALVVSGNDVYAGGRFTRAGGGDANFIARWDGTTWSALGEGMNQPVSALAVSGSELYAGGYFSRAGGGLARGIARWDGSQWSPLAGGVGGDYPHVLALTVSGGDLYAGGDFTFAGDIGAYKIAKWNGSSWSALGEGMGGPGSYVSALAVSDSDVYAGGSFSTAGGVEARGIARWDGVRWSTLGDGIYGSVFALARSDKDVYAGGDLITKSVDGGKNIAQWNGNDWKALGENAGDPNSLVSALAVSGGDLYVGGSFRALGGVAANNIARWDGENWSSLGEGLNDDVNDLLVSNGELYAGGLFTKAGGVAANSVARWNGSSWSALGEGMGAPANRHPVVIALAESGSELYAGGSFTTAGGVAAATNVAKWDGTKWAALGSGIGGDDDSYVVALAVSGNDLYVGNFIPPGGISDPNVSRWNVVQWNGTVWSSLCSGTKGYVAALEVWGSDLYVGGQFSMVGDIEVANIAKWNGSVWSALGSGIGDEEEDDPRVSAFAVSGSALYAGGFFARAGDIVAHNIAQWNGSRWSALGGGTDDEVGALAASGNDLYAGGSFAVAGGKVSACVARARLSFVPDHLALQVDVPASPTNTLTFSGVPGFPYLAQYSTNLYRGPWLTFSTNAPAANGIGTVLDSDATNAQRFYRVGYEE